MRSFIFLLIAINTSLEAQVYEVSYYSPLAKKTQTVGENHDVKQSTLRFNPESSIFIEHATEDFSQFDDNLLIADVSLAHSEFWHFKDYRGNELFSFIASRKGKEYFIKDEIPKIDWQISTEHRKLGSLKVIRAECHFRGRDYTAWFTPEIPSNNGPWKLGGLPGLILELYDEDKDLVYLFKSLRKLEDNEHLIERPTIPEEVITPLEFYRIGEKEYKEYMKYLKAKLARISPNVEIVDIEFKPLEIF